MYFARSAEDAACPAGVAGGVTAGSVGGCCGLPQQTRNANDTAPMSVVVHRTEQGMGFLQ
jgi:hypothetical protein